MCSYLRLPRLSAASSFPPTWLCGRCRRRRVGGSLASARCDERTTKTRERERERGEHRKRETPTSPLCSNALDTRIYFRPFRSVRLLSSGSERAIPQRVATISRSASAGSLSLWLRLKVDEFIVAKLRTGGRQCRGFGIIFIPIRISHAPDTSAFRPEVIYGLSRVRSFFSSSRGRACLSATCYVARRYFWDVTSVLAITGSCGNDVY